MQKEKMVLGRKYRGVIEEKFGTNAYFSVAPLVTVNDEDRPKTLQIFKYLFSLGEEAQTYLWNEMYVQMAWLKLSDFDASEYSEREWQFLTAIECKYQENIDKYGDTNGYLNINCAVETERLLLKPFDNGSDAAYCKFFVDNKDEFENYYGVEYDKIDVERYAHLIDQKLSFAITLKESGQFIGAIALNEKDTDVLYNLEYYVLPSHRRHGYACEAVSGLIEEVRRGRLRVLNETIRDGVYVEEMPNVKCILANINVDNAPSITLVKKLGFICDGLQRYHRKLRDTYMDFYLYTLLI